MLCNYELCVVVYNGVHVHVIIRKFTQSHCVAFKALSVREPFATAILNGEKKYENRKSCVMHLKHLNCKNRRPTKNNSVQCRFCCKNGCLSRLH